MDSSQVARFFAQCSFSVFNLSVIAYIYRDRQKKPDLRTGFFALFLAVSTSEVVCTMLWAIVNSFPNAFNQAAAFAAVMPCNVYVALAWFYSFHDLVHTAIAFNRFSCFCYPDRLSFLGTPRYIRVQFFIYGIISMAVMLPHLISQCSLIVVNGHILPSLADAWTTKLGISAMVALCVICTVLSSVFSAATVKTMISLRRSGSLSLQARHEIGLLCYSLLIFVLQAWHALIVTGMLPPFRELTFFRTLMWLAHSGFADIYTLIGPLCIIVLSSSVRKGYVTFYGHYWCMLGQSDTKTRIISITQGQR